MSTPISSGSTRTVESASKKSDDADMNYGNQRPLMRSRSPQRVMPSPILNHEVNRFRLASDLGNNMRNEDTPSNRSAISIISIPPTSNGSQIVRHRNTHSAMDSIEISFSSLTPWMKITYENGEAREYFMKPGYRCDVKTTNSSVSISITNGCHRQSVENDFNQANTVHQGADNTPLREAEHMELNTRVTHLDARVSRMEEIQVTEFVRIEARRRYIKYKFLPSIERVKRMLDEIKFEMCNLANEKVKGKLEEIKFALEDLKNEATEEAVNGEECLTEPTPDHHTGNDK